MTIIDLLPLILLFTLVSLALCAVVHRWAYQKGAASERIKLQGNTLPRFENPPPPPPMRDQYVITVVKLPPCPEPLCTNEAIWRVQPDRASEDSSVCCTDHMHIWMDRLQGKPYKITRIRDGHELKKKGVPAMKNHPPMPKVTAYHNPKDKFFSDDVAAPLSKRMTDPEVTPERLIEALFDYRLDTFIAHHSKRAKEGEALYYNSRKEVAEYLMDMYHITPKAKH